MQSLLKKRILLVDDEPTVRAAISMLIEALGGEIAAEAEDGLQALELYRRGNFDIVVTDHNMPRMRGDALADAIKAINPAQRVVMVSGFAEQVLRNGLLPASIDALVHKPCRLDELQQALQGRSAKSAAPQTKN